MLFSAAPACTVARKVQQQRATTVKRAHSPPPPIETYPLIRDGTGAAVTKCCDSLQREKRFLSLYLLSIF